MKMVRPFVIANFAITADGKVSTRKFTPTGFTGPADKKRLQEIRGLGDALLAGARTVAKDNMSMGISALEVQARRKAKGLPGEPLRIIVSNRGDIDPKAKVFQKTTAPLVVFSTPKMPEALRAKIAQKADLWIFETKSVDLASVLQILREDYAVKRLVCEGGPSLFRALVEIQAIDELNVTWSPLIFGGAKAPTLTGPPGDFLKETTHLRLVRMRTSEEGECFLTYRTSRR